MTGQPEPLDPSDRALADALRESSPDEPAGELLTLDQLAQRTGLSVTLLETLAREGLLVPSRDDTDPDRDDDPRYAAAEVEALSAGLDLLRAGLPLGELLALARRFDAAMGDVAEHAVEVFTRFVRDPVQGTAPDPDEAATRLVEAFETMLPAASRLVAHRFRGLLLARARDRLGDAGEPGP